VLDTPKADVPNRNVRSEFWNLFDGEPALA
jgi:hypothetical protein